MSELSISGTQVLPTPPPPPPATEPFRITTNAPQMSDANLTPGRRKLQKWLGRVLRIVITDGRVLVGFFNCTDRDANIVLSMCAEYLVEGQEPRLLGNVMVAKKHIVSLNIDEPRPTSSQLTDLIKDSSSPQV